MEKMNQNKKQVSRSIDFFNQGERNEENKKLEDDKQKIYISNICCICMDNKPTWAFQGCGHLCLCEPCLEIFEKNPQNCPLCRDMFMGYIRIY